MRTSVARTTPEIGGAGEGSNRRYPPTQAATKTTPSTRIRRLAMGGSPLDQGHGHHCKREISDRKDPQSRPVTPDLPQARAQLVDTNEAVDREIRREDGPGGLNRFGDRLARPGEAGQEELRQAGAEENERRSFWTFEPGPNRLAHEARC